LQHLRPDFDTAALVGWGVHALLLGRADRPATETALKRIAGMGSYAEVETELYAAVSEMIDDPAGYGLFVMDCDAFGGIEAGRQAVRHLRAAGVSVPVILLTATCPVQEFPEDRVMPVVLRSPLTAVSFRVGFEHAMRDRLMWRAA